MGTFIFIWIGLILLKLLKINPFDKIKWGWVLILPLLYILFRLLWEIFGYILAIIILFGGVYYFACFGSWIFNL